MKHSAGVGHEPQSLVADAAAHVAARVGPVVGRAGGRETVIGLHITRQGVGGSKPLPRPSPTHTTSTNTHPPTPPRTPPSDIDIHADTPFSRFFMIAPGAPTPLSETPLWAKPRGSEQI